MDRNYSKELVDWLIKNNKTIATAESLTGGMVASGFCDFAGVSKVFLEGIVAYSNLSKVSRLGVSEESIRIFSPVSEQVCKEMAEGVRRMLGTDYGISTTGLAGPEDFDDFGNPRGLFYIGIAMPEDTRVFQFHYDGTREYIRKTAMSMAFEKAFQLITTRS